jgi:hypothetical protein
MDVIWVLIIFSSNPKYVTAKDLKDLLAFKTQVACEHMITALSDPTYRAPGSKPTEGMLCVRANVQSQ